ncbi:Fic family protein [Candidatus Woesearchaeota archaeon]|nr:Fic family protein [Candidatus Woesearchaeota archaeon]
MVNIREKKIGNKTYYYLEHTIRENNNVKKKELYLGKTLPKNIDKLKQEFLFNINKDKWYKSLEKIKHNFSKEKSKTPKVAIEKQIETFVIKFTYDTQKIEGSTLTLKETANLLEYGITPRNRPIDDVKETEAHKKVFYEILRYKKDLSLQIILYWHKKLFEETKKEIAGKIRTHQVAIARSKFIPPFQAEIYPLIREFFKWYEDYKNKLNPVELAALVHLKFVTIHPFSDGNGRISRLMMNFILNKNKYPMLNISYKNRDSYYTALERSQVNKNDNIFLNWFIKRYLKDNKNYLKS